LRNNHKMALHTAAEAKKEIDIMLEFLTKKQPEQEWNIHYWDYLDGRGSVVQCSNCNEQDAEMVDVNNRAMPYLCTACWKWDGKNIEFLIGAWRPQDYKKISDVPPESLPCVTSE